jgi:hypothetical protein
LPAFGFEAYGLFNVIMNCTQCGNPLEKDAQFCPKCFARIEPPPSLWRRFCSLFAGASKPRRPAIKIKKTVTIRTTDAEGRQHEYHSLADVPQELRAEIEKVEGEALKERFTLSASEGLTAKFITKKTASVFRFKDTSGNEQVYHSLDEMPPEIRAAFEDAKSKMKGLPGDG